MRKLIRFYENLRIRRKLITTFSVLLFLIIVVGFVSIVSLFQMRGANEKMYHESTQPLEFLASMYDNLANQRICISNMIIFHEKDSSFAKSEREALKEKEEAFESALEKYSTSVSSDDERILYEEINRLYFEDMLKNKELLLKAISSNDSVAMASTLREIDEVGSEISSIIDEVYEYNIASSLDNLSEAKSIASISIIIQVAVILFVIFIAVVTIVFLARIISAPLNRVMNIAEQVAHTGSMNFAPEIIETMQVDSLRRDEIGHTTAAFRAMLDNFVNSSITLNKVAQGDLSVEICKASEDDTLGNAIEIMLVNLNNMFGEVKAATTNVSGGASQIANGAQTLSLGSAEQASAVSQLSATVSQVLLQTKENSASSQQALAFGEKAKNEMMDTVICMEELKQTVEGISTSSEEVSKIIKAIDDIAFQTNILALNAAVEAARAGQQGKGFAVVADEVRNLANKSAEAARESAALIQLSVENVQDGIRIVEKTGASVMRLADSSKDIQGKIVEISQASKSQESAIVQINDGIDQIFQVVQNNTATAEESAAASEELSGQSQLLKQMMENFTVK